MPRKKISLLEKSILLFFYIENKYNWEKIVEISVYAKMDIIDSEVLNCMNGRLGFYILD